MIHSAGTDEVLHAFAFEREQRFESAVGGGLDAPRAVGPLPASGSLGVVHDLPRRITGKMRDELGAGEAL